MPIEVRELQIKVTVNQPQQTGATSGSSAGTPAVKGNAGAADKIIADAIEQVLEIMRNKNER